MPSLSILIVDDSEDASEPLAIYLERSGHKVRRAPNGNEGLIDAIKDRPDVVLLDLYMPKMDGATFLKLIRNYVRLKPIPVVVLTAFAESPLAERAERYNVKAILSKGDATFEKIKAALEAAVPAVAPSADSDIAPSAGIRGAS
jgi:CheY-like chemotaxis protein